MSIFNKTLSISSVVAFWVYARFDVSWLLPVAATLCGVELTTGDQATPRGLKVGDTLDRAQLLYGPLVDLGHGIYQRAEPFGSAFHLCFQVQDQTITKIGLYNNLWGMEG